MSEVPGTKVMRAWQYSSTAGGLDKNLVLNPCAAVPKRKPDEHLVKVLAAALNPMDYKPAEVAIVHRLAFPKPATPGYDFVGRIVESAAGSKLQTGELVFGAAGSPFAGGALAEYAAVPAKEITTVPEGLAITDAASIPMAGITAWQSTVPYIRPGSRVFINGGSGGTGCFGIQLAKEASAHVTTSCSTANIELCKALGADEVLDYKASPILGQLRTDANAYGPFDLVVDYVGADHDLYWQMHTYSQPKAPYIYIGWGPSLSFASFFLKATFLPGFLGGGKRKLVVKAAAMDVEQIETIGRRIVEGKIKGVVGKKLSMNEVVSGFELVKSGRSKGKVVVEIE